MKTFKELIKESVKAVKEEEKKVDKPWKVLNKETDKVVRSFETAGEAEKFISNSSEGNKKYYKDYKKADGKMVGESILVKEDDKDKVFTQRSLEAIVYELNKFIDNSDRKILGYISSIQNKDKDLKLDIDKDYRDIIMKIKNLKKKISIYDI